MKHRFLLFIALLVAGQVSAQVTSGTVVYKRTIKIELRMDDHGGGGGNRPKMPDHIDTDYELLFDGQKCLFREAPSPEDMEEGGGPGRFFRMMSPNGVETFCDLETKTKVSLHELGDKSYIVTDSLPAQAWKLTNETKDILGHNCRKALTQRIVTRMSMTNDNGQFTRKEFQDTLELEAWYAEDIPFPAGPDYFGTLPGMIMEMSADAGRIAYVATELRKSYEKKALKAPKGEAVTKEDLKVKQEAFFENMRGPGGGH
jgi:GLPGLI family protein